MKLAEYLRQRGETPTEFATRIGRSESTITRLIPSPGKKQIRKPGWRLLADIALATGGAVTANDFAVDDHISDTARGNVP